MAAKSRPVRLISRSLSASQSHMLDSGRSCSPKNCRLDWNYDLTSTEKSDWVGILISQALRNQSESEAKTQRQLLKCGTETSILFQVPRDRENWGVKYRINLQK